MKRNGNLGTTSRLWSIGIGCVAGWTVLMALWQGPVPPAWAEAAAGKANAAKDEPPVEPPRLPSTEDILQGLMKKKTHRPIIPPSTPGGASSQRIHVAATQPTVNPARGETPLHTDGSMLIDRVGRLVRRKDGWVFVFESDGKVLRDPPMRLLPNSDLEMMEIASANGTRPVKFSVSGEVTAYRGANYLLLRKVLVVHDMGNLK